MIQFLLECIAFQLLFLIIYDLFLKRETFFQWNRVYLIGTFILSLVLPWIKIEAFSTTVSSEYFIYPEYLWGMNGTDEFVRKPKPMADFHLSVVEIIFYLGILIAAGMFFFKLYHINRLKSRGDIRYFKNFTRVVVHNSNIAFSFFKSIFLGDEVLKKEHESIIQHELVHIEQGHSWDLLFFELMRIISWFNPLVYVYQSRISELHEFIADAKVAKSHKSAHYQLLLSQVFQTQHISFINPFFKSSLIKKRIVMLQKSKSKKIWQLKYLLIFPLILGMLVYTSCQEESEDKRNEAVKLQSSVDVPFLDVDEVPVFPGCEDADDKRDCFKTMIQKHIAKNFRYPEEAQVKDIQGKVFVMFVIQEDGSIGNVQMRGPDKSLEDEAARIVSLLPKMTPAKQKGKTVRVPFSIPINFKLDGESDTNALKIRGENGTDPLYIIDGVESTKEMSAAIIPERVESISVFKGEEAIKKYGQAGKNGVIEIKTKSEDTFVDDGSVVVPFAAVDEVPVFPGCEGSENKRDCFNTMLQKHIGDNFRYPEEAQEKGIQGKVSVVFMIQKDGSIGNVQMRGPDKSLEDEAARIVSLLPKMTPGKHKGKEVEILFSMPINFKLQ